MKRQKIPDASAPGNLLEVTTRFELVDEGFADPCLTTWPRHHIRSNCCCSIWSGRRGSNSLPPPWQGGALPDELRPHIRCVYPRTLPSDSLEFRGPRESLRSKILWGRGEISGFVPVVLLARSPNKFKKFRRATRIGLEPTTPSVTGWCSNQLSYRAILEQRLLLHYGAADEARTRYLHLGKVALYQMSYGRILGNPVGFP